MYNTDSDRRTSMAKCAASIDDQRAPKRARITEGTYPSPRLVAPSPKADEGAWRILETFLTTDATYPQTEEAFMSYLGDRYSAEDWKDALAALFSGDGNDSIALANLRALKAIHVSQASTVSLNMTNTANNPPIATTSKSASNRNCRSRRPFNPYINDEAEVEDDDEDEEDNNKDGLLNRFIDDQARESDEDFDGEAEGRNDSSVQAPNITALPGPSAKNRLAAAIDDIVGRYQEKPGDSSRGDLPYKAVWSPSTIKNWMYLLLVHRTVTQYIAEHLQSKGFAVTVLAWVPGQLYVVSDSPRMISASLPPSHSLSVREYQRISEEEREAVECLNIKLPQPSWVRIKHGKYKDTIAYVFNSEQSNLFVEVLVPPRDFPYPMPKGSVSLLDHSHLLKDNTVAKIIRGEEISRWDTSFVKKTIVAFSMQFLRAGNAVRVIQGAVCSEIGKVQVSKYYLDRRPMHHTFQPRLPAQQHYEPPPDESIQVGDHIKVLAGEHMGKCGIVSWFSAGATQLWFCETNSIFIEDETKCSLGPPVIHVTATFVQRMHLPQTITYTTDRGYDVRPGDVVSVAHGPEYQTKGIVQSVDFPNAHLTILSESDQSLIDVPIRFMVKLCNAPLDSFRKIINDEVFLIGGDRKGFRATLHSVGEENCIMAPHGQVRIRVKCKDVATKYGMRLNDSSSLWTSWSANPQAEDASNTAADPSSTIDSGSSSVDPGSSTLDPWTVDAQDIQDSINARAEKSKDNGPGPLPWLMSKEFASQLLTYHALFKVSLKFNGGGGKLHRRFVSTACPDPFCGANGPAPEGSVAVFCALSNKGATLQHYHIPARDLCPAPPCRKNQLCLILDGAFRGQIRIVSKCNVKLNTAELVFSKDSDAPGITLRFDQICLVELSGQMMSES
ncbi:hypothetical protein EDD22DRAFT_853119 [Suillus occidentalis]|nr:hypothetical protein EDD22DRAFT_853119 [Suillus occidentalis]